jgi:hexosaminidase
MIRIIILITIVYAAVSGASVQVPADESRQEASMHLMPLPQSLVFTGGNLRIDAGFRAALSGARDSRLTEAAGRFLRRLRKKTGVPLAVLPVTDSKEAVFKVQCDGLDEQVQSIRTDESYSLQITNQDALLEAPSPVGILRGLETFLQLVDLNEESHFVPALKIEDRPRFCWRGLLIDVSRHWEPPQVMKRNLDAMAAVKMNVLHWHLSDDQGFRAESNRFPKLQREASDGKFYTQREMREIVAYARDRGIRIIPEFDMPGHTTAWLAAYPELASAPGPYQVERFWGIHDPCMNAASEELYTFLDSFLGEMAEIFPDEYFHIGGDEVNGKHWNANSAIQSFKTQHNLKDNRDLHAYFNKRLYAILAKHGKKMIGWDEILHPDLQKDIVIQSWRGLDSLADGVRSGYMGILSFGYYLDHMQPASYHYLVDPTGNEAALLTADAKSKVLGGEACMWAEFVTPDNIESRIWPRAAAIAERLWSPAESINIPEMYRRLEYINRELDLMGLRHTANYSRMLQRLVGNQCVTPLKIFADILEPTWLGTRQRTREYSQLTPLNRLVDVVLPESDTARRFEYSVDAFLSETSAPGDAYQQILESLIRWRDNGPKLKPLLGKSYLLQEAGSISEILIQLSNIGIQALDYIESRKKPSRFWQIEAAGLLDRAEKPHAEMLLAIVPSIRKLVWAANSIP